MLQAQATAFLYVRLLLGCRRVKRQIEVDGRGIWIHREDWRHRQTADYGLQTTDRKEFIAEKTRHDANGGING